MSSEFVKMKLTPIKILIVDNDEPNQDLYRDILDIIGGITVISALDGESAIEKFNQERLDIVITDIVHPGPDGIELVKIFHCYPKVIFSQESNQL